MPPDEPSNDLSISEHDEGRNRLNPIFVEGQSISIGVQLCDEEGFPIFRADFLDNGCHPFAGRTPFCPEINHNG